MTTSHWKADVEATSFNVSQFPPEDATPEIAVAGRSNVGKSTLINALLGGKLAYVGGTPGKTRSVNFYSVKIAARQGQEKTFRLVDLPGYGYAERSKSERKAWSQLTSSYVEKRKSLILVCHLVDFRHGLLANDRLLQDWLDNCGRPIFVLFTKADKIARSKRRGMLQQYVREGLKSVDVPIVTSAEEKDGIAELRAFLEHRIGALQEV
ncbi:MAG: ribosome biogenesis GTP-binding protein YihA/YsxC [Synergistaceae bacterium]|jgi:GTP-binding protein|nr:ribosome biogenesis GTP-binding protein YihA/YsxC [Synergistaceae bacterium]